LIDGTETAKVLSSRKQREKEDRIGESQPFKLLFFFRKFYDEFSTNEVRFIFGDFYANTGFEESMKKRAQGRKPFGRRNFKRRYFRLTSSSLSYAKDKIEFFF
jgi:hypothetical protein